MVIRSRWLVGVAGAMLACGFPVFGADRPEVGVEPSRPGLAPAGRPGELGSAGVKLYRDSSTFSTLSDSMNTLNQREGELRKKLEDEKDLPEADRTKIQTDLKEIDRIRTVQKTACEQMLAQLKDPKFIQGFGSNGGEEFLSYMNISESLVAQGGDKWKEWDTGISQNLQRIQNDDGSWTGHHCITGRGFCTASALLTLMADRAPVPVAKKAVAGETTPIANKGDKLPATELKPAVDPKPLSDQVKKGLRWLAEHQLENGGFGQGDEAANMGAGGKGMAGTANVGDTCAATLALIRSGSSPTQGDYAKQIVKAVEFVCDSIEKSDADGLAITDVKGTRLQGKLGPFIDTFMASLLLPEVLGKMPDEKSNKRVQAASDKLLHKLDKNQKKDGTWSNEGWAPVLAQSVVAKGLNRNSQMMSTQPSQAGEAGDAGYQERMEKNERLRVGAQSNAVANSAPPEAAK